MQMQQLHLVQCITVHVGDEDDQGAASQVANCRWLDGGLSNAPENSCRLRKVLTILMLSGAPSRLRSAWALPEVESILSTVGVTRSGKPWPASPEAARRSSARQSSLPRHIRHASNRRTARRTKDYCARLAFPLMKLVALDMRMRRISWSPAYCGPSLATGKQWNFLEMVSK